MSEKTDLIYDIGTHQGDDWGTISPDFAPRNDQRGTRSEKVEVDAFTIESILKQHAVPYYMEIDIEGAALYLAGLYHFDQRPRFVSIEIDLISFSEGFDSIVIFGAWGTAISNW